MIRATDFEFRNRWWFFGFIFSLAFLFLAFDHIPVGVRLADRLAAAARVSEPVALRIVYGLAAISMIAAALVRTWGSSYLGREVVHDGAVHSEALHADGPYRHVRNPLYLGNLLMALAIGLFASAMGWLVMVIGITVFCYRLIGREEAALGAEQGESYGAFLHAVPRLLPSIGARIPAAGATPNWISGLAAEVFFWSFTLGVLGFALTLNLMWFYAGMVASPLLSWLAGLAVRKRSRAGLAPE